LADRLRSDREVLVNTTHPSLRPYSTSEHSDAHWSPDPEESSLRRQDVELIRRCVAALPPDERLLIGRHYLEEEPFERSRKELGLSRSKARTLHERAFARMRHFAWTDMLGKETGENESGSHGRARQRSASCRASARRRREVTK
jgi:DNA-directed RNA polymerase specialized sigma24 family protein